MAGNKCKSCGSSEVEVDAARGNTVCTNCGTVLEDSVIVAELQYEETAGGGHSALGQFVSAESKGGCHGFGPTFHGQIVRESREATLHNAKRGISNLCQRLVLNNHCFETAFNFYKMALNRHLTRGRKNTHVLAACVYITCRIEATPHLLIDFSDVLQICAFELGRTYLRLSQALCISIPSMDPCLYVLRYANRLELGDKTHEVAMTALRLVQRMKRDFMHSGRRPSGLCGAALLMAARLHDFNRTVGQLVKIVHVHENTLRKRLLEFGETPSSSLTLDEFMNVDLEEEQDPPSYKAARAKDRERLQKALQEEETNSKMIELRLEIEKALETRISRKRKFAIETSATPAPSVSNEQQDTERFINESTLEVIKECLVEEDSEPSESFSTKGLGPSIECMGLVESITMGTSPAEEGTTELDLEGLDEDVIDSYILTGHEGSCKNFAWTTYNADYLRQKEEDESKISQEKEEGKPEKRKKKNYPKKNRNWNAANTAGEAIEKMLLEKKISTKINYDVLKSLSLKTEVLSSEVRSTSSTHIKEKTAAASPTAAPDPDSPIVKQARPRTVRSEQNEELSATTQPSLAEPAQTDAEPNADGDLDDYEEDEEEAEGESYEKGGVMSLSDMFKQQSEDDNYYNYDEDDY